MTNPYRAVQGFSYSSIVRQHVRSRGDRLAFVEGDIHLTWAQFDARVDQLCHYLQAQGVGAGDRILWFAQNSFRVFECLIAAARLGAIYAPVNWRITAAELAFMEKDLQPKVVIWQDAEVGAVAREVQAQKLTAAVWLQHDVASGYEAAIAPYPTHFEEGAPVDPFSPLLGIYTAAFGGFPNCALLTHMGMMLQNAVMMMGQRMDVNTVHLAAGPLFHVGCFLGAGATLHAGGVNVVVARVDAEEMLGLIQRERCTHAYVAGPTIQQMREINADGKYDVSSLWSSPAAPEWTNTMCMPVDAPMAKYLGGYGQSETVGMIALKFLGGEGGSGRISLFAEVAIFDEDDKEVAAGETGEIRVRGPMVFAGYYNRDEHNASRIRNGWHCTNDLGRLHADGSISFVGPKMRMIKSAVENIYPIEVENALRSHPAVADVCVIGVPDPRWDQSVKALVIKKPDIAVTGDDLIEHCKAKIASYKKPRFVEFVESIARKPSGEVDRERMDELHGGGGYPKM